MSTFTKKRRVSEIRQTILKYNTELLRLQPKLNTSDDIDIKYNKLLIKKAILKKELDDVQRPVIKKIVSIFKSKEKKISDYFVS